MIERCRWQVRAGFGGAYSLDFAAVLALAEQLGAPVQFVADLLSEIEPHIVASHHKREE